MFDRWLEFALVAFACIDRRGLLFRPVPSGFNSASRFLFSFIMWFDNVRFLSAGTVTFGGTDNIWVFDLRAGEGTNASGTITQSPGTTLLLNFGSRRGTASGSIGVYNLSGGSLTVNGIFNLAESNGSQGLM